MSQPWLIDLVQRPNVRKLTLLLVILFSFTVMHRLLHPDEIARSMGRCTVLSALLYSLNITTGIGGFWQPTAYSARATAVLQNALFLLLVVV